MLRQSLYVNDYKFGMNVNSIVEVSKLNNFNSRRVIIYFLQKFTQFSANFGQIILVTSRGIFFLFCSIQRMTRKYCIFYCTLKCPLRMRGLLEAISLTSCEYTKRSKFFNFGRHTTRLNRTKTRIALVDIKKGKAESLMWLHKPQEELISAQTQA